MKTHNLENLLLVGLDLVAMAKSAKAAGFKVYAVDYFGDYDLVKICDGCRAIIKQEAEKSSGKIEKNFNPKKFVNLVKAFLKEVPVDALLLSSGLDDSFEVLEELDELVPILGNKPEVFKKVRDKPEFFKELKRLNLLYPETIIVESLEDAKRVAKDIGYPVVVKPSKGFAGVGIRKALNPKELKKSFQVASSIDRKVLIQEYIAGVNASISFISSANQVKVLTINEQLLGLKELGQQEPFGFCGNIVPLDVSSKTFQKCHEAAEKIASHFGLLGSNGIDFIFSNGGKPYVIEVNPRFQATFECIERALNLNIIEMHVKACLNEPLPRFSRKIGKYCTRLILFSKGQVKVENLAGLSYVRDVPFPEVIIEEGEPLCSVIAEAENRELSLKKALEKAEFIYRNLVRPI